MTPDPVVDPTLTDPTPAQTGDDNDVAAQALADFAAHVADTSVKDLLTEAAEDDTKAAQILAIEEGRGDAARSSLITALQKQLASEPGTDSADVDAGQPPAEIVVDDTGRQVARPDLIDNSELDDPALAAEKLAADEDAAVAAARDSGRLVLEQS